MDEAGRLGVHTSHAEDMGCPRERAIQRPELQALCMKITICDALPVDELRRQCQDFGLDVDAGGEDEPREALLDRLVERDCMIAWDSRGFQALRIGDYDAVLRIVSKYEEFAGMSDAELSSQCAEFGICLDAGAGRGEHLERLKMMMVWEMPPLGSCGRSARGAACRSRRAASAARPT